MFLYTVRTFTLTFILFFVLFCTVTVPVLQVLCFSCICQLHFASHLAVLPCISPAPRTKTAQYQLTFPIPLVSPAPFNILPSVWLVVNCDIIQFIVCQKIIKPRLLLWLPVSITRSLCLWCTWCKNSQVATVTTTGVVTIVQQLLLWQCHRNCLCLCLHWVWEIHTITLFINHNGTIPNYPCE